VPAEVVNAAGEPLGRDVRTLIETALRAVGTVRMAPDRRPRGGRPREGEEMVNADTDLGPSWPAFGLRSSLGDRDAGDGGGDGAVLPSQVQAEPDWRQAAWGEIALRQAILEDAIACFQRQFSSGGQRARRLGREAEHWLFRDERRWAFSFHSVCEALGVEARAVRRWLADWRESRRGAPRMRRSHMVLSRSRRRRRRAAA
jgi:hypothetical protein